MIAGHLGVAAAARSRRPGTRIAWLVVAAYAPDILDLLYAMLGICSPSGLYSHTIPAAALTAAVLGGAAMLLEDRATSLIVVALVFLHLPFDWPTGQKLFWPGGEIHGLGWYDWPLRDFIIEAATIVAGFMLLVRAEPRRRKLLLIAGATLIASQAVFDSVSGFRKPSGCVDRVSHSRAGNGPRTFRGVDASNG